MINCKYEVGYAPELTLASIFNAHTYSKQKKNMRRESYPEL